MLFLLVIVLCVLFVYLFYRRLQWMSKLKRNGIRGPKPHIIFGNMFDFNGLNSIERQNVLLHKYGKVVGYYNGAKPTVLVADPELSKHIQIKDFQYFYDRQHFVLKYGTNPIPVMSGAVHRSRGSRWKEIRSILTPTFSAAKLKTMTPLIDDAINTLLEMVDKNSREDNEFDIYDLFQGLTTDVIGRTAFGIQSNVQMDPNNKFLKAAKDVFAARPGSKWYSVAVNCFPQLDHILYYYRRAEELLKDRLGRSPTGILLDMSQEIINIRKTNSNMKRKDLLQLMMDSKISGQEFFDLSDHKLTASTDLQESDVSNNIELDTSLQTKVAKHDIRLSEDEIRANCVLFYEAGYETTSTALGFAAHILVNKPEVQERVRREVLKLYETEGRLDFNTVTKLEYMEWMLNETMRLYPPLITFVTRETIADYSYGNITIPKGTSVQFATYFMHHDPDQWPDPEKFDPERFSAGRRHEAHPSSWQPFGNGPRNCVGMRFAFFEMKLCLAKLLLNYRLEPGPRTERGEITVDTKLVSLCPKYGVFVKAVKIR
ncbi:cytochrome P450 3A24-like [Oppia nitens]|uniref:cytochrome P450 3A24-like n=1 Tax=Oppia nitens TaxID=1686743 RepID=UPI0023DCDDA0|nr:cytochrome P450 3A24-like [Oppia nitens]